MLRIVRHSFLEYANQCLLYNKNATAPFQEVISTRTGLHARSEHTGDDDIRHVICSTNWTPEMLKSIIQTAISMKCMFGDTHGKKLNLLPYTKVMILDDHNEPILRMAITKAVTMLGGSNYHIRDKIDWDHAYQGRVFSEMADAIFVSTATDGCLMRFSRHCTVPVVCMRSRKYATIQSVATIMSILEDYGTMDCMNLAYVGAPHQVLNDYLVFVPMLGANLKFKCCCKTCGVSPLLLEVSKCKGENAATKTVQLVQTPEVLKDADVIIAGPTTTKKEKIPEFELSVKEIQKHTNRCWTYYHTFPRGAEADDKLFFHEKAKTFNAFRNTQFIAAALLTYALKHNF